MYFFEDALCLRARMRAPGSAIIWDPKSHRELDSHVLARHEIARAYCARCPLLEPCEAMLADAEARRERIEGVVAARYSIVRDPMRKSPHQEVCKRCQVPLRQPSKRCKPLKGAAVHAGEGLCEDCFPVASRAAAKRRFKEVRT